MPTQPLRCHELGRLRSARSKPRTSACQGRNNGHARRLLLRHFGASSVVYLNGRKLASFALTPDAPLPQVDLASEAILEGRNVLAVVATPFESDRARERALKVPPAVLRVETRPPPFRRRLFNGLAQLILQSNGAPGPIRLSATAKGLARAELTVEGAPPDGLGTELERSPNLGPTRKRAR